MMKSASRSFTDIKKRNVHALYMNIPYVKGG